MSRKHKRIKFLKKHPEIIKMASENEATPVTTPATTSAATPATTKYNNYYSKCHDGPIEIYKNLYLGSMKETETMVYKYHVDVLCSLYSLDGKIWDLGFRGEILYYPCTDYSVLPEDVARDAASKIIKELKEGKRIGISCMGGHGRTGYLAAIVLGKLGVEDPIELIRTNYCDSAVESNEQVKQIAKILNKPELEKTHEIKWEGLYGGYYTGFSFKKYGGYQDTYKYSDYGNSFYPNYKSYKNEESSSKITSETSMFNMEDDDTPDEDLIMFGSTKKESGAEFKYCRQCRSFKEDCCQKFWIPRRPYEEVCDDGKER